MLPPFIIDQIRQREEQDRLRREADRPRIQLPVVPVDALWPRPEEEQEEDESSERGVAILEL